MSEVSDADHALDEGPSTIHEILLINKDAKAIAERELVAADFSVFFRSHESDEFEVIIGGNVSYLIRHCFVFNDINLAD